MEIPFDTRINRKIFSRSSLFPLFLYVMIFALPLPNDDDDEVCKSNYRLKSSTRDTPGMRIANHDLFRSIWSANTAGMRNDSIFIFLIIYRNEPQIFTVHCRHRDVSLNLRHTIKTNCREPNFSYSENCSDIVVLSKYDKVSLERPIPDVYEFL